MSSPLFIENPGILVDKDYIFDFIPDTNATMEERINAIVRFSLYFSVLLMIVKNNSRYIYIFIATLIITFFFYSNNRENFTSIVNFSNLKNAKRDKDCLIDDDSSNSSDDNLNKDCDQPTCNNLFMNVLPTTDFSKKKEACSFTKEVSKKVNKGFYNKFKKDVNTFYNQDFGMRQFYSMPNTKVPNDQGAFANWLYNTPVSCSVGDTVQMRQFRGCALDASTLEDLQADDSLLCLSKNYTELN
tara:strand:+ start:132 stop:860 length:729 start_codon:yes stop_codon:yes gene_type:complete